MPESDTDLFSLGCGDPTTLAGLRPGQTVLDLGSGSGVDCLLAADLVGDDGRVIGVDMTLEMVRQARLNAESLGVTNVEFRLGEMERLPVEDESVDVILSNCAVNLCPDLAAVFREAFRTLRPGGILAVSDIVLDRPMPKNLQAALPREADTLSLHDLEKYESALLEAGFTELQVEKKSLGPDPRDSKGSGEKGTGMDAKPRARMAIRVGETGETLAEVDLEMLVGLGQVPRSIQANIRAMKPSQE